MERLDSFPEKSTSSSTNVGRWSDEEHNQFLQGLKLYGRDWKAVQTLIPSRTVVQIRTHAQKYFQKLAKEHGLLHAEKEFSGMGNQVRNILGTNDMYSGVIAGGGALVGEANRGPTIGLMTAPRAGPQPFTGMDMNDGTQQNYIGIPDETDPHGNNLQYVNLSSGGYYARRYLEQVPTRSSSRVAEKRERAANGRSSEESSGAEDSPLFTSSMHAYKKKGNESGYGHYEHAYGDMHEMSYDASGIEVPKKRGRGRPRGSRRLARQNQFDSEAEEYDGSSDSQIAAESDVENGVFEEDDDYHPNRPHNRRLRPGQWQRNKSMALSKMDDRGDGEPRFQALVNGAMNSQDTGPTFSDMSSGQTGARVWSVDVKGKPPGRKTFSGQTTPVVQGTVPSFSSTQRPTATYARSMYGPPHFLPPVDTSAAPHSSMHPSSQRMYPGQHPYSPYAHPVSPYVQDNLGPRQNGSGPQFMVSRPNASSPGTSPPVVPPGSMHFAQVPPGTAFLQAPSGAAPPFTPAAMCVCENCKTQFPYTGYTHCSNCMRHTSLQQVPSSSLPQGYTVIDPYGLKSNGPYPHVISVASPTVVYLPVAAGSANSSPRVNHGPMGYSVGGDHLRQEGSRTDAKAPLSVTTTVPHGMEPHYTGSQTGTPTILSATHIPSPLTTASRDAAQRQGNSGTPKTSDANAAGEFAGYIQPSEGTTRVLIPAGNGQYILAHTPRVIHAAGHPQSAPVLPPGATLAYSTTPTVQGAPGNAALPNGASAAAYVTEVPPFPPNALPLAGSMAANGANDVSIVNPYMYPLSGPRPPSPASSRVPNPNVVHLRVQTNFPSAIPMPGPVPDAGSAKNTPSSTSAESVRTSSSSSTPSTSTVPSKFWDGTAAHDVTQGLRNPSPMAYKLTSDVAAGVSLNLVSTPTIVSSSYHANGLVTGSGLSYASAHSGVTDASNPALDARDPVADVTSSPLVQQATSNTTESGKQAVEVTDDPVGVTISPPIVNSTKISGAKEPANHDVPQTPTVAGESAGKAKEDNDSSTSGANQAAATRSPTQQEEEAAQHESRAHTESVSSTNTHSAVEVPVAPEPVKTVPSNVMESQVFHGHPHMTQYGQQFYMVNHGGKEQPMILTSGMPGMMPAVPMMHHAYSGSHAGHGQFLVLQPNGQFVPMSAGAPISIPHNAVSALPVSPRATEIVSHVPNAAT